MAVFNALIFDLDGTLIDSAHDIAAALNEAFRKRGWPTLAAGDVENFIGNGPRRLVADILEQLGVTADSDDINEALSSYIEQYSRNPARLTRFYPHVREDLNDLYHAGFRMGICTNKPQALTEKILDVIGIGRLFDAVVGADAVPKCKPDPGHLRAVADRMSLRRDTFAYVGDTTVDLMTARHAEVPFFVVPWGKGAEVEVPSSQRLERLASLMDFAPGPIG